MITLPQLITTDTDVTTGLQAGKTADSAQDFLALLAGALGAGDAQGKDAPLSLADLQAAAVATAAHTAAVAAAALALQAAAEPVDEAAQTHKAAGIGVAATDEVHHAPERCRGYDSRGEHELHPRLPLLRRHRRKNRRHVLTSCVSVDDRGT